MVRKLEIGRPIPVARAAAPESIKQVAGKELTRAGIGLLADITGAAAQSFFGPGGIAGDAMTSEAALQQRQQKFDTDRLTALSPAVQARITAQGGLRREAIAQTGQTDRTVMTEEGKTERERMRLLAKEKMDNINIESQRFSMELQKYNAGLDSKFGKKRTGRKGIPRGLQKGFDDARARQAEMFKLAEETRDPVLRERYLQEGGRAYKRMTQFQRKIDEHFGIESPDDTEWQHGKRTPPKKSEKTAAEIRKLDAQAALANANASRARLAASGQSNPEATKLQNKIDNLNKTLSALKSGSRNAQKQDGLLREIQDTQKKLDELPLGEVVPTDGTSNRAGAGSARNQGAIDGLVTPVNNPTTTPPLY